MLAVQGPSARALVRGLADGSLPSRFHCCERTRGGRRRCWCAAPATPARTASSCCSTPTTRRRSGTRSLEAGATPVGLGARDTLRLEVCFHLYGNDLSEERGPIEAGLGLVLQGADRLHRLRERSRACAPQGTGREARPVRDRGPGHRAAGQPGDRRRRGHERHVLAVPGARHRDGVRSRASAPSRARSSRSTCAARSAPAVVVRKPLYRKEA